MKLAVILIALILAAATTAHAQSAVTPSTAPTSDVDQKSPMQAIGLSIAGTAIPFAILATGISRADNTIATVGMIGTFVGPSIGHWYAGEAGVPGLAMRGAGGALFFAGMAQALKCVDAETESYCDSGNIGGPLALTGAVLFATGTIYDIATAGRAAERWNNKHHLQIAPTVVGSGSHTSMGMGIGGTF